jgi:REP element-mobilizing transposase RayT
MPDHFHWLMQLGGEQALSQVVNNVKGHSTRKINIAAQRKGGLWQKGFFDRAVRRDDDLLP